MVTKTARRKTSGLRFAVFGFALLGFICNGACTGACNEAPGPAAGDNSTPGQPLRHPQRIISLTLGTDEILCALVEPERIAALSYLAADPENSNVASTAKKLGSIPTGNIERIVHLQPDLILAAHYTEIGRRGLLERTGAPVVLISAFRSFHDIEANIMTIGRAVGEPERAQSLIGEMRAKLQTETEKLDRTTAAKKKTVLYLAHPNWTAGSGTTLHEVISYAGFRNAAAEHGFAGHGKISIEKILSINPDAILIGTGYNRDEGFRDRLLGDPLFAPLDAVRRRRIVALPSRQLTAVSHHLADCVTALRDVMAEISIAKTVQANHKNNQGRIGK